MAIVLGMPRRKLYPRTTVSVRLEPELVELLHENAKRMGRPFNTVVRTYLLAGVQYEDTLLAWCRDWWAYQFKARYDNKLNDKMPPARHGRDRIVKNYFLNDLGQPTGVRVRRDEVE